MRLRGPGDVYNLQKPLANTIPLCFGLMMVVVLVGDPGVGKTNLLATFVAADAASGVPTDEQGVSAAFSAVRKPTIGVEFGTKIVRHPATGKRIKAQIWDTGASTRNLMLDQSQSHAHLLSLPIGLAGQERYRAITSSYVGLDTLPLPLPRRSLTVLLYLRQLPVTTGARRGRSWCTT